MRPRIRQSFRQRLGWEPTNAYFTPNSEACNGLGRLNYWTMISDEERRPGRQGQPAVQHDGPGDRPRRSRFPWKTLVALLVLGGIAVLVWQRRGHGAAGNKTAGAGRGAMGPVAVVVGTVGQKDVPIYLDGLGMVQAFNTVTVRSRVDGQLLKLAFREGQDVKAGELLAQIDPAPFQTQLEQVRAKKAQDE